jgi:hypothetical protein
MKRDPQRAAWTAFVEGTDIAANKYGVAPKHERGGYASVREKEYATKLWALASRNLIHKLQEQESVVLVPGNGKLKPIIWVADFTYEDDGGRKHYIDVKGCKTPTYRLKKRLATLLLGIKIEEV